MVDSPSSRSNANAIDQWQAGWYGSRTGASVEFAAQHLTQGMDLLDIGCGAGTITLDLARIVHPGRVLGIDFNEAQIERAEANLRESGLDNVAFVQGDGADPDFELESFDAVVAFSTLQWLRDPARTVQRAFELLRPGGMFAARDRDVDGDLVGGRYRDDVLAVWDMVLRVWEKERHMEPRLGRRLRGLAADAGFSPVHTSAGYESWGTDERVTEHIDWYGLTKGRVLHDMYLRSGFADEATLQRHYKRLQRWASQPDSWFAACRVEVVGWKPR